MNALTIFSPLKLKQKGGLDNYLKTTSADILGDAGMKLRLRLLDVERQRSGRPLKEYRVLSSSEGEGPASEQKTVRLNMPASLQTARLARKLAADALQLDTGQVR